MPDRVDGEELTREEKKRGSKYLWPDAAKAAYMAYLKATENRSDYDAIRLIIAKHIAPGLTLSDDSIAQMGRRLRKAARESGVTEPWARRRQIDDDQESVIATVIQENRGKLDSKQMAALLRRRGIIIHHSQLRHRNVGGFAATRSEYFAFTPDMETFLLQKMKEDPGVSGIDVVKEFRRLFNNPPDVSSITEKIRRLAQNERAKLDILTDVPFWLQARSVATDVPDQLTQIEMDMQEFLAERPWASAASIRQHLVKQKKFQGELPIEIVARLRTQLQAQRLADLPADSVLPQWAVTNRLIHEQRLTAIAYLKAAGPNASILQMVADLQHMGMSINVDGVLRLMDQSPSSEPLIFNKETREWLRGLLDRTTEFDRAKIIDSIKERFNKLPDGHRLASEILAYRNEVLRLATARVRTTSELPPWLRLQVIDDVSRKEILEIAKRHHKKMTRNEFLVHLLSEGFSISAAQLSAYVDLKFRKGSFEWTPANDQAIVDFFNANPKANKKQVKAMMAQNKITARWSAFLSHLSKLRHRERALRAGSEDIPAWLLKVERKPHPQAARIRKMADEKKFTHTRAEFLKALRRAKIDVDPAQLRNIVKHPFKKIGYGWSNPMTMLVRSLLQENPIRGPLNVYQTLVEIGDNAPTYDQVKGRVSGLRKTALNSLRVGLNPERWMQPGKFRKQMMSIAIALRDRHKNQIPQHEFSELLQFKGLFLTDEKRKYVLQNYPAISQTGKAMDLVISRQRQLEIRNWVVTFGPGYDDFEIWAKQPDRKEYNSRLVATIRRVAGIDMLDGDKRKEFRHLNPMNG